MRLLIAGLALVAALATTTASAQSPQQSQLGAASTVGQHASQAAARGNDSNEGKVKANEKAYDAALKNLPDKQYDPWRGVR